MTFNKIEAQKSGLLIRREKAISRRSLVQGWELQLLQSLGCYEGTGYKNKTGEEANGTEYGAEVVIRLCLKGLHLI